MKSLLNSIYKQCSSQDFSNPGELINYYVNKIHLLFLDILDQSGIDNLDEKIKVTSKFEDGYILTSLFRAGEHFIDVIFSSTDYEKEISKLDKMFLDNYNSQNEEDKEDKEDTLEKIKHIISEIAPETIDKEEWLKELSEAKLL